MNLRLTLFVALSLGGTALLRAQVVTQPDLKNLPSGQGWKGSLDATKLVDKDGQPAIEFTKSGVVWLEGFEFTNGEIEFDARGKSAPPQSNFMGVAFRVRDAQTYETVYFRPFNFRAEEPERKAHAVQYTCHPDWPWKRLRTEKTGQYEKPINPPPDGDAWFHARVVVAKPKISVYVNGAKEPSLVVTELEARSGGSVGFMSDVTGVLANLRITKR
jgi:hypothetical protein